MGCGSSVGGGAAARRASAADPGSAGEEGGGVLVCSCRTKRSPSSFSNFLRVFRAGRPTAFEQSALGCPLPRRPSLEPRGKTVALLIHGWGERYRRARGAAEHLQAITAPLGASDVCVFCWPCGTFANKLSYLQARRSAQRAGLFLRQALEWVAAAEGGPPQVLLVAHSMGCRVALQALNGWAGAADARPALLVMLGPAVRNDDVRLASSSAGQLPPITVLHSVRDSVLGGAFPVAELLPALAAGAPRLHTALGFSGPSAESGMPGVLPVDCSASVSKHSVHCYLRCPEFSDAVGALWGGGGAGDSSADFGEEEGDAADDDDDVASDLDAEFALADAEDLGGGEQTT